MRFRSCWSVVLGASLLFACNSDVADPDDDGPDLPDDPTYYANIKPMVDAKCGQCHFDGGIAPFAMTNYEETKTNGGVSMLALQEGVMPPWPPNNDCNDYHGNRSITQGEIDMFTRWVEADMPAGDPNNEGPPRPDDGPTLSRVDARLEMANNYSPTKSPDDYRCFIIPWPEEYTTPQYVTGFRAVPGNSKIVHHVIAFLADGSAMAEYQALDDAEEGPGYTCFGGSGGSATGGIGGWAPGDGGKDLPDGTGIRVEPGSLIIMQVHYNTLLAEGESDATAIELKIDAQVDKEAIIQPWANPQWLSGDAMMIPANDPDVMHQFSFDPSVFIGMPDGFEIHNVGLHLHTLGSSATLSVQSATGSNDCLLDIPDWDFDWQGDYQLKESYKFLRGDQLSIECHWDNSPENQPMLNGQPMPPRNVTWGEGTQDEMCLGTLLITPL